MDSATEARVRRVQADNKSGIAARMAQREKSIIDRLVLAYRSSKLRSEDLFGGIAAISELRGVAAEVERDLMLATDLSSQYQAGAENAEPQ